MPLTVSFEVSGDRVDAKVKVPDECPDFSLTESTRLDGALVEYVFTFGSYVLGGGMALALNVASCYIFERYIKPQMQSQGNGAKPGIGAPSVLVSVQWVTWAEGPVSTSDDLAQLMQKAGGGDHLGTG